MSSQDCFCFLPREHAVTGCDSSLGSFCYSRMILHFAFIHPLSGNYYFDYVIMGVLNPIVVKLKFSIKSPLLRLTRLRGWITKKHQKFHFFNVNSLPLYCLEQCPKVSGKSNELVLNYGPISVGMGMLMGGMWYLSKHFLSIQC